MIRDKDKWVKNNKNSPKYKPKLINYIHKSNNKNKNYKDKKLNYSNKDNLSINKAKL